MAFGKGKQKEKETKKPTTLAEYKAQGWEVSPYVGMSNPPVYTLTKDGETIKFRPKMKLKPGMPKPPNRKQPKKEATPMKKKDGGSASFPDLSGDGKVTKKDILMGRGVVKKQRGGEINGLMKMKKGGLAGRLAQRGYGKARK